MKKLVGLLGVLAFVACGGTEVTIIDREVPTTPPVNKSIDDVPPSGVDGSTSVDASSSDAFTADSSSDSSSEDAGTDAQADVADAYVADASDPDARAPELTHPECECHQKLLVCKQAFPDLNIDCGAQANCVDTPYFTLTIYGTQVGHRDVVGDPRQGCKVLGVDNLCCAK